MSRNCSSETACPANQECIYTGTGSGFCICPKGFTLDANGHCRDIDECTEMSDFEVCGVNSECINLPGSYQCLCSPGYTGNSRQGCTKIRKYFFVLRFTWQILFFSLNHLTSPHLASVVSVEPAPASNLPCHCNLPQLYL